MNLTNTLVVASTAFILVLLWLVIGAIQLKAKWQKISVKWEILDESLRKRQSLVPLLIETFRGYDSNENLINSLMQHRSNAAREYRASAKKIEYENDLSKSLNELFAAGKNNVQLMRDTTFLAVQNKINSLESMMENESKQYNEAVRSYNEHVAGLSLFLIAKLFGYKKENIFDVES